MNTKIPPFGPNQAEIARIMKLAPVKNLTEQEVLQTLRLEQLHAILLDPKRTAHMAVTIYQDDNRLEECSDEDKFLALLLDADCRNVILTSKRCIYAFGNYRQHWQKIARSFDIVTTRSAMLDGDHGGQFYGKGWVIAPHIATLRKWINDNKQE